MAWCICTACYPPRQRRAIWIGWGRCGGEEIRRRLVLLARESPLHLVHLRNMVTVTEMGAIVCPPMPAFYQRPRTVDYIVQHGVARTLDLLGLDNDLAPRWPGLPQKS